MEDCFWKSLPPQDIDRVELTQELFRLLHDPKISKDIDFAFAKGAEFYSSGRRDLAILCFCQAALMKHPLACMIMARVLREEISALELETLFLETEVPKKLRRGLKRLRKLETAWTERALEQEELVRWAVERNNVRKPERKRGDHTVLVAREAPALEGGARAHRERLKFFSDLTEPMALQGEKLEIACLRQELVSEFPWFKEAVDQICDHLDFAYGHGSSWFRFPPLLLLGPPGVGKTRFVRRLCEKVSLPVHFVNAGHATSVFDLAGLSRVYDTAVPSAPALVMQKEKCANPILVLDEIDKAGGSQRHGFMVQALLSMMEPETARQWRDPFLDIDLDLSHISWVLTANEVEGLPEPLMSRLTVVEVGEIPASAFEPIYQALRQEIAAELEIDPRFLPPLAAEAKKQLARFLSAGGSVRKLKKALRAALNKGYVLSTMGVH